MGTPSAPPTFTSLLKMTRRASRLSAELVERARVIRSTAGTLAAHSRRHREERSIWAGIMARLRMDQGYLVLVCAYCHRVQGERGWSRIPAGIEHQLRRWTGALLSHGYCPDCLQAHHGTGLTKQKSKADN